MCVDAGKVYKVRLNNSGEGKDAVYFVAKKMFLEGLSEEEVKSAYGEVVTTSSRYRYSSGSTMRSRRIRCPSLSVTRSFSALITSSS